METIVKGAVGPYRAASGVETRLRQGVDSELIVQLLHGSLAEQVSRGNVFSIGCQLTALSAATIALTASGQPIVGVWNPATSGVNLVILQAALRDQINTVSSVAPGDFIWCASVGNTAAMTAGLSPVNRKTLLSTGSAAKAFSLSTASLLTGLTTTPLVFIEAAPEFNTASAMLTTTVAAATPTPSAGEVQNFDGSLIVPPGGVFGLFNTISSVTHSVAARLLWEEIPV